MQPLVYLSVFVLLGLLANRHSAAVFRERLGLRVRVLFCSVLVMGLLVFVWYREASDTITLMLNTDYPGHRISSGGDYPLSRMFYGVFESWKVIDKVIPFPPVNPSEASSFWILFPMAPLLVPLNQWSKPVMRPVIWMMVFCMLTVAWASLPLPEVLRTLMANAGWYLTPATRCDFALAVASAMLMATLTAAVARGEVEVARFPVVVFVGIFAATLGYGWVLQLRDPEFFNFWRVGLAALVVVAIAWSILRRHRGAYLWLAVLVAVPSLHVNPVQSGLGPYLHKGILAKARDVSNSERDLWAVFGNTDVAQGFKAVGLNVVNGTHYAPRMSWLDVLDPDHRYQQVWNRYAHIALVSAQPGQKPKFHIEVADSYFVTVDVCGPEFQSIGVTHAAFTYAPQPFETRCLEPLVTTHASGVQLFKIVNR